jgi:hypothetical protein
MDGTGEMLLYLRGIHRHFAEESYLKKFSTRRHREKL